MFLSGIRAKVFSEDGHASEEASQQKDPEPPTREYGFRLHLVPAPSSGPDGEAPNLDDDPSDDDD